METQTTKKCTLCEKTKQLTEFYKGFQCKDCIRKNQRERNKQSREKNNESKNNPELKNKPKTCIRCNKEKTVGDFRINRGECIECERAFGRKYNKENHNIRKKWQDENKEHYAELQADWYQLNKPKVRTKYRERYANDYGFRIRILTKSRLCQYISKTKSTEKYIGTKYENVARWIEYNFTNGMTWKNHGTVWDVDHVIPVCKWDLKDDSQIDACFNWKNLSPYPSAINRNQKREKINPEQVESHLRRLQEYFIENELDKDELIDYLSNYETIIKKYF